MIYIDIAKHNKAFIYIKLTSLNIGSIYLAPSLPTKLNFDIILKYIRPTNGGVEITKGKLKK
tara:strand:+ start:413 stop:598 length:186 start_codon:yes stop_codon:yes gene_type:complete